VFAKNEQISRQDYLDILYKRCFETEDSRVAKVRSMEICRCYQRNLDELVDEEIRHLYLDVLKLKKKSTLSKDVAQLVENYELEVYEKCKKNPAWSRREIDSVKKAKGK
jgi:hypothetical protein